MLSFAKSFCASAHVVVRISTSPATGKQSVRLAKSVSNMKKKRYLTRHDIEVGQRVRLTNKVTGALYRVKVDRVGTRVFEGEYEVYSKTRRNYIKSEFTRSEFSYDRYNIELIS